MVRPAVARGAAQAEHATATVPREHGWVITAIDDDDPDRAVMDARRMIAFYLTVKTYDPYVEHHGWTAQTAAIREAFAARDTDAMARAVTDDMLEAIAVCGTTADGRAALARRGDSLPRDVAYLAPPSFMVSERRGQRYALASLALLEGLTGLTDVARLRGGKTVKFTVDYPIVNVGYDPALVTAAGMTRVAQTVEECGYDAISFSEHPAPSRKWLDAGGHESLDQTSALTFCAAVTSRVRLMTYLLVLPYHNPFLAAKALSTVDLLSGGRLTVVAGTGYLRSEFLALNVDMSQRNELFDESLEVLRGVWSEGPFTHQGKHFSGARPGLPARAGPARRAAGADRRQQRAGPCPRRPQPGLEPADGAPGGGTDLAHPRHRHRRRAGRQGQGGPRRGRAGGTAPGRRHPADHPGAHPAGGLHAAAGLGARSTATTSGSSPRRAWTRSCCGRPATASAMRSRRCTSTRGPS